MERALRGQFGHRLCVQDCAGIARASQVRIRLQFAVDRIASGSAAARINGVFPAYQQHLSA